MIKTIIVNVDNHPVLALAPQLAMIPYRLLSKDEGVTYEVIRHSAAVRRVRGHLVDSNFDFAVTIDEHRANWTNQPGRLPRAKKSDQDAEINKAGFGLEKFIPLRSYSCKNYGFDPSVAHVLKPEYAARGIGQVYVPVGTPVDCVMESIRGSETPEMLLKEYSAIGYNTHNDRHENEGWKHLRNNSYFVQEFVGGVTIELRLLVGVTQKKAHCGVIKRERVGSMYKQATGSYDKVKMVRNMYTGPTIGHAIDTAFGEVFPVDEYIKYRAVLDQIALFIERLGFAFGSLDLFFRTNAEGDITGWGLFEYSTEFGYSSFNATHVENMVIDWYLEQVRKHVQQQADVVTIPLPIYGDIEDDC